MPEGIDLLSGLVARVEDHRDADVIFYSGPIAMGADDQLLDMVRGRKTRRRNVLLVLTTYGGDAGVAYRIARCLQESYEALYVLIGGWCKSAGTLLVLGADKIFMNEAAHLGPLDVQVRKPDEYEHTSGLTPTQALIALESRAREAFQSSFHQLVGLGMTSRSAASIASELVGRLYGGLFSQVDPMRVAETQRLLSVAKGYGERLLTKPNERVASKDTDTVLTRLIASYPSHDFVIDRREAAEIFEDRISQPTEEEAQVLDILQAFTRNPRRGNEPLVLYLDSKEELRNDQPGQDVHVPAGRESPQSIEQNEASGGRAGDGDGEGSGPVDARDPAPTDGLGVSRRE